MTKIAKLPEPRGRVRFLSDDERTRLLAACTEINSEFIYPLVVLALSTGARHGELIHLQWKDVDFKRKAIVLQDTKNGERRVVGCAGEGKDRRLPLPRPAPYRRVISRHERCLHQRNRRSAGSQNARDGEALGSSNIIKQIPLFNDRAHYRLMLCSNFTSSCMSVFGQSALDDFSAALSLTALVNAASKP